MSWGNHTDTSRYYSEESWGKPGIQCNIPDMSNSIETAIAFGIFCNVAIAIGKHCEGDSFKTIAIGIFGIAKKPLKIVICIAHHIIFLMPAGYSGWWYKT